MLARAIGAVIDHMHADAALRDLDVMRQAGWIVTTPLQARARADVLLLVGPGLHDAWPDLDRGLGIDIAPPLFPDRVRRVIRLGVGAASAQAISAEPAQLPVVLGVLRAVVAGRPVRPDAPCREALRDCATVLASARFGVAVWSAASLDPLAIEMLCGLIDDLNATTRFAGLPLAPLGNAAGIAQMGGWMTGYPLRIGFGRGRPEHDCWRFDAARMIDSNEADVAVWISALEPRTPSWRRKLPLIALVSPDTVFDSPPHVRITVGCPGIDHSAVLFGPEIGALSHRTVASPGSLPSVAEVLGRIQAALPNPC